MGNQRTTTALPKFLQPFMNMVYGVGGPMFQDVAAGQAGLPAGEMYGGLQGLLGAANPLLRGLGQAAGQGGLQANAMNQLLSGMGMQTAGGASGLNALMPGFLGASAPFMSQLQRLVGQGGEFETLSRGAPGPFAGQVTPAALAQIANTGPQGDIYNRSVALLRPQVRSAFSSRGLGSSGAAIREESNQIQQLADAASTRAMQERIGLLGAGAQGEQANAAMTNALGDIFGRRLQGLGAAVQGALGGAQLPGQIFGQMQGGLGQGLQNMAQAAGLNLSPIQAAMAGTQGTMQGYGAPFQLAQQAYQATRAPIAQGLGIGGGGYGSSNKK